MERGVIMEVLSPSTPITQKYYKRSLIHTRRSELKSKKCVAILVSMTAFQVRRFGDVAFAKIRVTLCSTSRQCLCRRCKSIHVSPCFLLLFMSYCGKQGQLRGFLFGFREFAAISGLSDIFMSFVGKNTI